MWQHTSLKQDKECTCIGCGAKFIHKAHTKRYRGLRIGNYCFSCLDKFADKRENI